MNIVVSNPSKPVPQGIVLHQQSRTLELSYENGETYQLPFEYLRVYSPSAEVQGHGEGQAILQIGKRYIDVTTIEMVGRYALQPSFSDGHRSGIYSWGYLYRLATEYEQFWQRYLEALAAAQASRD